MGVSITPSNFTIALEFLAKYYNPVSLQDVLNDRHSCALPPRSVLVTFDDGYASVIETAIPVCQKLGVPAVLFLNAAFVNNHRLSADNLVCHVANTLGMDTINAAVRAVKGNNAPPLETFMEVFAHFFPFISLAERDSFLNTLIDLAEIDERQLAIDAGLYVTNKQLQDLSSSPYEIGNHTRSHVHCRSLSRQTFCEEIDRNKTELERLSRKTVRSFSVPYGSSADLSSDLVGHLRRTGHELIFLSEAVANSRHGDGICLDRVGFRAHNNDTLFFELEVLPRLRVMRKQIKQRPYTTSQHATPELTGLKS